MMNAHVKTSAFPRCRMVNTMKKNRSNILIKAILIYLCFLLLVFGFGKLNHLIFRQTFRQISGLLALAGLTYLMFRAKNRIPAKKKAARLVVSVVSVLIVIAVCFVLAAHAFFETDRESTVIRNGQKKIKVESSFILYYEVAYYDYGTRFWYKAYPCIRESYDDGDPDQWIYTDYYDETGALVARVFADE